MITQLQATALKGHTFLHELSPCTLITGDNFAGKSARMDALRLAVCGKMPELGGKPRDTFDLASGLSMDAGVTLADGNTITRTFSMEKGSVKSTVKTSLSDEELEKLAKSPLFNTSAYFGLTESQKIQFVFENCPMTSDITVGSVTARLKKVKLEETNEQTEDALATTIDEVSRNLANRPLTEGITALVNKEDGVLSTSFTTWNRRAKDSEGTVRLLTELKLRENEASAENIGFIEAKIAEKEDEAEAQQEKLGALNNRIAAAKKQSAQMARLNGILNQPPPNYEAELTALRAKRQELAIQIIADPMPTDTEARKLYEVGVTIKKDLDQSAKLASEAQAELAKLDGMQCCPFCKSIGDDWKSTLRRHFVTMLEENADRVAELTKLYTLKKAEYETAQAEVNKKMAAYRASEAARTRCMEVERDIQQVTTAQQHEAKAREEAKVQMAEITSVDVVSDADVEAQERTAQATRLALNSLREQRDAAKKLQQDIARAAQAALEHEVAAAKVAVIKAFGKELKVIQQEIINGAFTGMLTVANKVAGDVLLTPLAYHEGEVGRWDGARFISHKTFSGTEQAVCHIAIAAALSANFPMKIVLLDELARVSEANTVRLLNNLRACVEDGTIHQVLAIDLRNTPREGWKQIAL